MTDSTQRFEILAQIAAGDYATVFRARDRELGREVAIKQIHPQFLQDPRQLDRYWKEAQLLASLEHPHIMMIYDIVRERGWLVLELMQGSLQQLLQGRPIDLNDLRMALTYIGHALQFMHQNGIVHGDVKPSNLLVDRNHRVKLGDFGIARRMAGEHGSVVKGTTKYMAPEVVSDQFGKVGPHSDLYSLGFSAYELLCGENFESLFPGLNMYGRDRQMAWLMWHSTPDRRLPEINRVLQGVPPDLAFIIQKLTEKDPARRYRTADQLLEDLKRHATQEVGPTPEELAAQELAERRAKRKRRLTIAACLMSITLSMTVAFWPAAKPPPPPPPVERPTQGIIGEIDLTQSILFLQRDGGAAPQGISIDAQVDRLFVNDQKATLADLRHDDQVQIKYLVSDGAEFLEIYATRPQEKQISGSIGVIDVPSAALNLLGEEGQAPPEPWYVPADTPITINDQRTNGPRQLLLADLRSDDRVTISYVIADGGRQVAKSVVALRTLTTSGSVAGRNPQQGRVSVNVTAAAGTAGGTREFVVARDCVVLINGLDRSGEVPLTIADLVPGDRITLTHDVQVQRIEARRDVTATGTLADLNISERTFTVQGSDPTKPLQFTLGPTCTITGPQDRTVEFAFLRKGDAIDVEFAPLGSDKLQALKVVVRPLSDPRTWAIVIAEHQFDDAKLPALPEAAADAQHIRDALLSRYRVPTEQLLVLDGSTRLQIEQGLTQLLARVPAEAQLVCYATSATFLDKSAGPILAVKEIDTTRLAETGLPLRALIKQLESCAAREKILLLDSSRGPNGAAIPSSAEHAEAAKEKPTRPVSSNVLVIASCDRNQRNLTTDSGLGVFGSAISSAFAGAADTNRDGRVAVAELLEYLPKAMATEAGAGRTQSPVVFPPDNRPPRLTANAQDAVRKMLGHLRVARLDESIVAEFQMGDQLAPGQPDMTLAYALVLLRNNRTPLSRPLFERVRVAHPRSVVAHQALAWQNFLQGKTVEGIADLRQVVDALPDPAKYPAAEQYFRYSMQWAGALREFALSATDMPLTRKDVEELDRAIIARGDVAKEAYRQGIEGVREAVAKLDAELMTAAPDRRATLNIDRRRVTYYTTFNFNLIADYLRQSLED